MPEFGNAINVMYSDPEWKIDPDNPLVWAPPLLKAATKFEFMHGPVQYYIETIYQLDEDDDIMYGPDGPIVLEMIRHTDTWMYSFGWYVNTDAPTAPGKSGFTQGGWVTRNNQDNNREVIEVPLDAT